MAQSHYINKLKFTVDAPRSADGFALQSAMSQQFWQNVLPALSDVFDRFVAADEVIKIERLDIDLSRIPFKDWETALTPSVCRAIQEELERVLRDVLPTSMLLKGIKVEKQSVLKSQFDAWLYFLETGQLPRTASLETDWRQAALYSVAVNATDVAILKGLLGRNKIALERLVLQHDEPFLISLADAISGRKQTELKTLRETFETVLTADYFIQLIKEATQQSKMFALPTARDIEVAFWVTVFEQLVKGVQVIDNQLFIINFLLQTIVPTLKNDYAPFLKTLIAWEKPKRQEDSNAKETPSVKEASKGDFLEKQTAFIADENLVIAPRFIQFIKTKAANAETAAAIILFFEKEISQHKAVIQPLMARFFVQKSKPIQDVLAKENIKPKVEEQATVLNKTKTEVHSEKMGDKPKTEDIHANKATNIKKEHYENLTKEKKIDITGNSHPKAEEIESDIEEMLETTVPKITQVIASNAGIVLLHPFLKPFFEGLELLRGGKFENRKAQRRAAAILHYLATGKTEMAEYDMVMPKLLVGLPLERPVDRRIVLTDLERTEADGLLNAVIKHWKAIGHTSPDGLREGFLKRSGKLTHRSDGWLLQMEAQTLDILLDRLPWGLGIVRLSWMKEMLFVEWY